MTVKVVNIIPSKYAEASQTTQYIAENCKTIIDKFTLTNTTASAVTFSCNLVLKATTASAANLVIKDKSVSAGETYVCPELVGHSLEDGSFISTIASTADSLVIRASGREIT
ncbi:hypothetical protein [Acinetobacter calcoaceticus]|uniref:hypothetical protein n=1 Tax=Acinetobacter calcoaceticus TaxID=471 RepID=UPI0018DDEF7F|nr:hypothetical protein [Acinetobacter calcoaceticus]